jgi:autotransporter-associated beta strand protein
MRQLVLAGDATVGGTGTWQINNGGGGASLSTGGNPYSLTKVGPNQVGLAQLSSVDAALADIEIQSGILEFSGLTPNMGDATRTNLVQAGGTLSFANGTVAWDKHFVLHGDGSTTTLNVGTGGNPTIVGAIELHGTCVFNVGGTALTIGSAITGDGDLTKNGASPLILTNVNTYPGETHINTGALRLGGSGSIASSSIITINAGATLTATGRIDGTLTLPAGQTLKGNGAVNGFIVANSGSTIAPGIDAIGALSVSNAVTLSGTNVMELDEANGTNDVLRCNTTITYGGTLNLVNLGGPLTTGSTFKLFNASSYLGSFSKINPQTPGPGQTWDLSSLNTLGTIKVASGQPIRFGSITASGGNVVISGSNGTPSGTYYVIATTNLELRFTNWTRIATNTFTPSGTFSFTNAIVPSIPVRFFQIQTP